MEHGDPPPKAACSDTSAFSGKFGRVQDGAADVILLPNGEIRAGPV
jgi:hypothetical protein